MFQTDAPYTPLSAADEIADYFLFLTTKKEIPPFYLDTRNGAIFTHAASAQKTHRLSANEIQLYQAQVVKAQYAIGSHSGKDQVIAVRKILGPEAIQAAQHASLKKSNEAQLNWLMALLEMELLEKVQQCFLAYALIHGNSITKEAWPTLQKTLSALLQKLIDESGIAPSEHWSIHASLLPSVAKFRIALIQPLLREIMHHPILALDHALYYYKIKCDALQQTIEKCVLDQEDTNRQLHRTADDTAAIWQTFQEETSLLEDARRELADLKIAEVALDLNELFIVDAGSRQTLLDFAYQQNATDETIQYLTKRGFKLTTHLQTFRLNPEFMRLIASYASPENALALMMGELLLCYAKEIEQQSASRLVRFLWWFTGGVTTQCEKMRTAALALMCRECEDTDTHLLRAYEITRARVNDSWIGPSLPAAPSQPIDSFWYFPALGQRERLFSPDARPAIMSSINI